MKVVIIEDELIAARNIQDTLKKYDKNIEVLAILRSVKKAVEWLKLHLAEVDLLLMDIKLTDGISFSIFDHILITQPIIFTTAYDEYAIRAFKVNSIDYILKPVTIEGLAKALDKWKALKRTPLSINYQLLAKEIKLQTPKYKNRFLVKNGDTLYAIPCEKIAYFLAEGNFVILRTFQNKNYPVNYSLEALEDQLDPKYFFRPARNIIVHVQAIQKIHPYFKGRLKIDTLPPLETPLIVSNKRASLFKEWIDN